PSIPSAFEVGLDALKRRFLFFRRFVDYLFGLGERFNFAFTASHSEYPQVGFFVVLNLNVAMYCLHGPPLCRSSSISPRRASSCSRSSSMESSGCGSDR